MRVLQVGNIDTAGQRFNGIILSKQLRKHGIYSENCVFEKNTNDPTIHKLVNFWGYKKVWSIFYILEKILSLQSVLYPFSFFLPFKKYFRKNDIIHYHLIHTGFFSLLSLPILTRLKPSVWSLHDPWAMTGHCIYPYKCPNWASGCGGCGNLKTPIQMKWDNSLFMWKLKKIIYKNSKLNIIVASKWMHDMAKKSKLFNNSKIHLIPYGIDLTLYKPTDNKIARNKFNIPDENYVICFRAQNGEYKGFEYIKECLWKIKTNRPITLLAIEQKGLLDEFKKKFQVIEVNAGWINNDEVMINAYNACDVFLMPSIAEAFGLMAVEAMACGKPVLTFKGTSLEEVVFAPSGGIAVPIRDSTALAKELQKMIDDPKICDNLGKQALKITKENYDEKIYINRIENLYESILDFQ